MLFRRSPRSHPTLTVTGESLVLRPPVADDFPQWSQLRAASQSFLQPWEPVWPADDLTPKAFRKRLQRYEEEIERDDAYPFLLFRRSDARLLGGLTLGYLRRGVAQAATLGYWMGAEHAGHGYMTKAVQLLCGFAFGSLGLRRVEAACLPENAASIRVLEKAGFQREGMAREYLCIAGVWRDHLLFARLSHDRAASGEETPATAGFNLQI